MMTMQLMSSGVVFLFVMVFLTWVHAVLAEGENGHGGIRNYISWEDLQVDEQRLTLKRHDDVRVIIVNKYGWGHSKTVQGAVDMVPDNNKHRVKIYIYPGVYREKVRVPVSKPYVSFIGKRNQTATPVITWNSKSSDKGTNGQALGTFDTATVGVDSDYFCASGVTFENSVIATAGVKGMQGVALRVNSARAMFYQVKIKGAQDSLLDNTGSHYFLKCHILGKVDFIFGNAKSLYENCLLESIADNFGAIAAHHRNSATEDTGFSFVGCSIRGSGRVYLGRAWGNYSRIIYSKCTMDDIIIPEGWSDWNHSDRKKTAVFGEYECNGKGADRNKRTAWSKSFSYDEAVPFLQKSFIDGDQWLRL
ncbi:pectinesterase QRT1-like [Vigna radiata var. radiata]|uniref:pectinesterase n=1 Tax=Vigna radiata var. radiata TaxID=3916 RepID=A0A1S3UA48_VIGRR|nr:pectinesterase QRT1-like [Vigna radiata var. radiata]